MDSRLKNPANCTALTPLIFLERAAASCGERTSIIYGDIQYTWSETFDRCRRLASGLVSLLKVKEGDVVSAISPNIPAMYELHFGVPMSGAVLNTLNVRLDAKSIATLLKHAECKVVFVDYQYLPLVHEAIRLLSAGASKLPIVVVIKDQLEHADAKGYTEREYEDVLRHGDPNFQTRWPSDEWQTISINYTSGSTAGPKGVMYHHRGAYLNSVTTIMMWGMKDLPIYLWTLPMFHCNGWCFTWAVAALAGTNVCLRSVTAKAAYEAIANHRITHLSGAPVVLNILASASADQIKTLHSTVYVLTGGAPPPPSILSRMEEIGFDVTHSYGLTETLGAALYCRWKPEWNAYLLEERAALKARQGIPAISVTEAGVMDSKTMVSVPRDGRTIGEVMLRGSAIMKGYLKDEKATQKAFEGGWFRTGDLGVMHPDGYIQLKDRAKDIIISGGENISSIEVEAILYSHPQILEAAVVARPDDHWGETPCAFVNLTDSARKAGTTSAESIIAYCRQHLPHYMAPRSVIFRELPKTATGKVKKYVIREQAKALGTLHKSRL